MTMPKTSWNKLANALSDVRTEMRFEGNDSITIGNFEGNELYELVNKLYLECCNNAKSKKGKVSFIEYMVDNGLPLDVVAVVMNNLMK